MPTAFSQSLRSLAAERFSQRCWDGYPLSRSWAAGGPGWAWPAWPSMR